jgi:hypothetical protein
MNKVIQRAFALLVLSVAAGIPLVAASGQGASPATRAKWEYRVLTREQVAKLGKNDLVAGLNLLGEEGWELVSVEPAFTPPRDSNVPARAAQFYLKRLKDWQRTQREQALKRVDLAQADVAMWQERSAWSQRMVKKGFMTAAQAEADQTRLQRARMTLEKAERELKGLSSMPKQTPEKEQKPAPPVGNSRKHAFRMENKRLADVFAWLAEETGLPVCQSGVDGSFTFIGPKRAKYTIPEIVSIINCTLVLQGQLLIQGEQSFQVLRIEDEVAEFLSRRVK